LLKSVAVARVNVGSQGSGSSKSAVVRLSSPNRPIT